MSNKKIFWAALLGIVILGGFLRFYGLGEVSFVADEYLDMNSSYAYHKTGSWQNWDFNQGGVNMENEFAPRDERAWMYKWQVAQLFKFFPPTEAVARSVSAAWGILTIILMFVVARDFTKKNGIGLIAAFLFAVSISGIVFDRRLRMYAMFFPVFLIFSWMTYKFLESDYRCKVGLVRKLNEKWGINLIFGILAVVVGIVSFNVHQLSMSIVPIAGAYLLAMTFLMWKEKRTLRNKYSLLAGIGILGGALALIFKPMAVLAGIVFFENHWNYFMIAFNDYSLILAGLMLLIVGAAYLAKDGLRKESLWLSLSFIMPLLMAMFLWQRNVGEQYFFFAKAFLIILIASGTYAVAEFFQKNLTQKSKHCFAISTAILLILLPNYAYFFQENNAYRQTSTSENPNYRSIFVYFKKHRLSDDALVTRNFRNYYWSGEKVKTYDFGGELSREKLTAEKLQMIVRENPSGWLIYSSNDEDYISKEAQVFAEENMLKVNAIAVRGDAYVYRWGDGLISQ